MVALDKLRSIQQVGLEWWVKFPATQLVIITDSPEAAARCTPTWAARGLLIVTVRCSLTCRRFLVSHSWTTRCNVTSVQLHPQHFRPQSAADWKRELVRTS